MLAKILSFIGFLDFLYCFTHRTAFVAPIWLLPLVYSMGMLLNRKMSKSLFDAPGLMMFNALMFFRYVLTPYSYYSEGHINLFIGNLNYLFEGTVLVLYEEIIAMITLLFTQKKYIYKCENYAKMHKPILSVLQVKSGLLILPVIGLLLLYIGTSYKSLGMGWAIFMSGQLSNMEDIEYTLVSGLGYVSIIWQSLTIWLYVYFLMQAKKNYEDGHRSTSIFNVLLLTFMLIILTFIDSSGITRWYTLVVAFAAIFSIMHLFPKYKRQSLFIVLFPVGLLILFASLQKNSDYTLHSGNLSSSANEVFDATNMDVYFNGVGNVKTTFVVAEKGDAGIGSIIPDVLKCMPVISHYIPMDNATSNIFHRVLGRDDQIVPMISQGYLYFGSVFAPLLTILTILFFRYFDYKFKVDNSYTKFGYAFAAVWFGVVAMCLNVTITFMWVYIRVVPFLFVLWITNKFAKKYQLNIKK